MFLLDMGRKRSERTETRRYIRRYDDSKAELVVNTIEEIRKIHNIDLKETCEFLGIGEEEYYEAREFLIRSVVLDV